MERISMYRHTVKDVEQLGDGTNFVYFYRTDWSSMTSYIPKNGSKVVKREEKEVFLEQELLDEH